MVSSGRLKVEETRHQGDDRSCTRLPGVFCEPEHCHIDRAKPNVSPEQYLQCALANVPDKSGPEAAGLSRAAW